MRILNLATLSLCACVAASPCEAQIDTQLSPADVVAINEVSQTFVKAILAKDWTTLAGLYLEDAILNPPNEAAVRGRPAIRAWMEKFPPLTAFTLNNLKVEGSGDLAYTWGAYTMTFTPAGATEPVKDRGKYVEIRRRQRDGRWLIVLDIFNSDLPAAAPAK